MTPLSLSQCLFVWRRETPGEVWVFHADLERIFYAEWGHEIKRTKKSE
jgi:hypothetical protein